MDGTGIIERMITAHSMEILESWAQDAERAAAARGLTRPELLNIMPIYLASLAQPGVDHPNRVDLELLESHLSSRLRAGFNLDEVVDEFAILGRAIVKTWSRARPEDRPTVAEIDRLLAILQSATTFVTALFTQHLLTDEQTEKRYLRLLAESFRDTHDGDSALSTTRLTRSLTIVMDALQADTATLLLYDATSHTLVTTASVGLADEWLTGYARSLDPTSLEGHIAASEQPSTMYDVQTTSLDVTDVLRNSGIAAVIGVRLPQHRTLLGVIYLGLRQRRSIAPRELRRLEALAEQLALHLDNAKLHADLVEHIEALNAERRLRDQLVSIVAHDLRGPLSAARVATRLLASKKAALASSDKHFATLARNLDRADRMVTDLLDVERLHTGQTLAVSLETANLRAIVEDVVSELSAEQPDRLVLTTEDGLQGVWDPALLRRAIWNLTANALKYGAPNTPVQVTATRTSEGVTIVVHNEGAPIPRDDQATIFEPFSRIGSHQAKGWGLGLAVVRGCADAHGGSVLVDSAPGRGTTFTMSLPLDARAATRTAA
jgi:signal transduction histidine kinase